MTTRKSGPGGASRAEVRPDKASKARAQNRARGAERRAQILDSAIRLIARRGSRGVSLVEIAYEAGVSKPGLLHHFPTKEALLHAALDARDAVDLHVTPSSEVIGLDVFDEVETIVRQWMHRPPTLGVFTELLAENLNDGDPLHDRLVARAELVQKNLARGLRAGIERGDVRPDTDCDVVAHAVIAFVNGLETYWQLDDSIPVLGMVEVWKRAMTESVGVAEAVVARRSGSSV